MNNLALISELFDSSDDEFITDDTMEQVLPLVDQDYIQMVATITTRKRRVAIEDYVEKVVPQYNNVEFTKSFRLKKDVVEKLSNLYIDSEIFQTTISHGGPKPINAWKQILIFLCYVGHESITYYELMEKFNVAAKTGFSIIDRVSNFLCNLGPQVIRLPTEDEKQFTKEYYYQKYNFPGIIGSIDGTHVKIDKPAKDPDSYINRKKYFSLQLQALVNERGKFLDVFAGYPGSCHDARVFKCSPLYKTLPTLCSGENEYILGDSAYPCIRNLMVPYKDNGHLTNRQKKFNKTLSSCRVSVEHAFGQLKQRFRRMYHLNLHNIDRMLKLMYSCCILCNLGDVEDLQCFDVVVANRDPDLIADQSVLQEFVQNGMAVRDQIAANL